MYRWVEHTSELELEIQAPTEEEVYVEAVSAMAELLGSDLEHADGATRDIALEASDRSRLLAAFLGEIAFLAETERFVTVALERLSAEDRRLEATLRGRTGDAPHLVKAVTYHRLAFDAVGDGWHARAVLDV